VSPLFGHDIEVADWIARRTGATIFPPYTAIGFASDACLVAGAAFSDCIPGGGVELTFACDGRLSPSACRVISDYVFNQLNCKILLCRTRKRNKKALKLARHTGFKYHTTIPDYFGDDSAVLFRMRRDECRWLS
jgi:RimJ/RimL family protein N-acetyltransferase